MVTALFVALGARDMHALHARDKQADKPAKATLSELNASVERNDRDLVTNIYVDDIRCDDALLEDIAQFTGLRVLILNRTSITDVGLVHLKKLKQLEFLQISNLRDVGYAEERGNFNGSGLAHLRNLPHLRSVDFRNTKVNDAALEHLEGLKYLQKAWLQRTDVTKAGANKLLKRFPKADIQLNAFGGSFP